MRLKESFSMWNPNPDARVRVGKPEAVEKFLDWLSRNFPDAAREVKRETAKVSTKGLGATTAEATKPWYETALDIAQQVLPAYVQAQAQRDLYKMQMDRAKQGLPPLDTAHIAPTMRVQAEVPGLTNMMPLFIIGALGLGAVMLMQKPRRGRR